MLQNSNKGARAGAPPTFLLQVLKCRDASIGFVSVPTNKGLFVIFHKRQCLGNGNAHNDALRVGLCEAIRSGVLRILVSKMVVVEGYWTRRPCFSLTINWDELNSPDIYIIMSTCTCTCSIVQDTNASFIQ